jgi:membrane protein YdbS with pleckstrin-like domain
MQGIYTYIPEKNHVPKQYNVAAILSLLFMALISLAPALALMYFYIRTSRRMCAVPNIAVIIIIIIIIPLLGITKVSKYHT